jgi:hypothetical protein
MKIKAFFILAVFVLMLVSIVSVVSAGDGNSPAHLIAQGWTCVPREGKFLYCMVPHWKTPNESPAAIVNKVFETLDTTSTDAPFVGTTTYLRADLYASQPCASSDTTEWVWITLLQQYPYYYCRHPVQ